MTARSAGDAPATLQSGLEAADVAGQARVASAPKINDPVALFAHLDASGRFHRDGRLGRMYHRGMVSFRENVSTNSLHVVVEDNRVKAHVDKISPLAERPDRQSRYSVRQALAHNRAGIVEDLVRLLRGRQGDHRCELDCTWVAAEAADAREEVELLDPHAATWSVQLEARVTGSLDEARLRAALGVTLGDLASSHDPLEVVDCADDDALDAARQRLYGIAVPVTRRPPMHVYLARHPAGDFLMLNLNHAATDGVGALAVLRHVARAYAGDRDLAALDFLAGSDLPVEPRPPSASFVKRLRTSAVERVSDLRSRPAGIAPDGAQPDEQATDRGDVRTGCLQPLTANRHIDSTLLCNLRCPDPPSFGKDAGETVELWFSPPARGPLTLCVGAVSIAGRLHLTFRYPRRLFDRAAADRFAGCYLAHLRATLSAADRP